MSSNHHRSKFEIKIRDFPTEKLRDWKQDLTAGKTSRCPFTLAQVNEELAKRKANQDKSHHALVE